MNIRSPQHSAPPATHSALLFWANALTLAWFALCTLVFLIGSRHWPLVNDAALMHYIAFLCDHGLRPYRDILDPNLPGSYLLDWTVIHTLGAGAAASRAYDLLLVTVAAGAMLAIGWRRDRIAALCAGCLFALFHGRDGMAQLAQRDLALAAALLVAIALATQLARRPGLLAALALGLTIGAATTIKPYAALFLLLLLPIAPQLPRLRRIPLLLAILAGALFPLLLMASYLHAIAATQPFLFTLFTVDPLHERLGFPGLHYLVIWCLPPSLLLLTTLGLLAACSNSNRNVSLTRSLLLTGTAIGLFAYFIQLKGFPYHRYPLVACLLLCIALEAGGALRRPGLSRLAGLACLATAAILAPLYAIHGLRARWPNDMEIALKHDLIADGSSALSHHIQCIDSIEGCTRVLYDMGLVQSTGTMYDEFLFLAQPPAAIRARRDIFLASLTGAKPAVIVITPDLFLAGSSAMNLRASRDSSSQDAKLLLWPAFGRFLTRCYDQTANRTFPHGAPTEPGYRLYRAKPHCSS